MCKASKEKKFFQILKATRIRVQDEVASRSYTNELCLILLCVRPKRAKISPAQRKTSVFMEKIIVTFLLNGAKIAFFY